MPGLALLWERQRGNWGLVAEEEPRHLSSRGSQGTGKTVMESLHVKPLHGVLESEHKELSQSAQIAQLLCSALL